MISFWLDCSQSCKEIEQLQIIHASLADSSKHPTCTPCCSGDVCEFTAVGKGEGGTTAQVWQGKRHWSCNEQRILQMIKREEKRNIEEDGGQQPGKGWFAKSLGDTQINPFPPFSSDCVEDPRQR